MNMEEAIAKAVKFLKLAQSDNPNEAALAAARAQEIIDRYKLVGVDAAMDPDKIGAVPENSEPVEEFSRAPMPDGGAGSNFETWRGRLASSVAHANQCRIYRTNGYTGKGFVIIGRASDAETVRYIYDVLVREVDRITEREGKGCGKAWRNNFRLGMVDTIGQRLRHQAEETRQAVRKEAQAISQTALVKVDQSIERYKARTKEVDDFYARITKGFRRSYSRSSYDASAREAGRKAGHEVSLGGAKAGLGAGRKALP